MHSLMLTCQPYAPDRPNRATMPEPERGQRPAHLECFYLLGDFGMRVNGVQKAIIPPPRQLGFRQECRKPLPPHTKTEPIQSALFFPVYGCFSCSPANTLPR